MTRQPSHDQILQKPYGSDTLIKSDENFNALSARVRALDADL